MKRLILMVTLVLPVLACGGDGGEGDGGGGAPDLTAATLAPLTLHKKTTMNEYQVVLDVPEGTTSEWRTVYFFLKKDKALSLRVVPNDTKDLAKQKASYESMNIKGFNLLVDEKDALVVEVQAHSGTDYEVYFNTEVGGTRYALQSVGLIPGPYSKAMALKILEWLRTVRAP